MAVGNERAHSNLRARGHGVAGAAGGGRDAGGIAMRGDFAEEAKRVRLVAALTALAGQRKSSHGGPARLVDWSPAWRRE